MKHYETNEGYTDKKKKKHKGKYKGDEMKIQISLSQPDNDISNLQYMILREKDYLKILQKNYGDLDWEVIIAKKNIKTLKKCIKILVNLEI